MVKRLLLVAVVIALMPALTLRVAAQTRPNIVLVVADDLGYGDLGSYGAPDITTPNLDRLAREGVRFTDFYANAPVCTPTRAGLMSGRYQQRVRLERPIETNAATPATGLDIGLPATGRSLPQLLKNAGYATGLVGKWHLGFKPEFQPNRHGFDYFWGYLAGYVDWYAHVRGDGQPDLWENGTAVQHQGYLDHELTRRAVTFIGDHASHPFFELAQCCRETFEVVPRLIRRDVSVRGESWESLETSRESTDQDVADLVFCEHAHEPLRIERRDLRHVAPPPRSGSRCEPRGASLRA
jgi:hypothetical protein